MTGTIVRLEMTSPTQLVPGRTAPTPLALDEIGPDDAPLIRSMYNRTWEPLGSGGRSSWSHDQWAAELAVPGVRTWIARTDSIPVGFAELALEPAGDVGIVVFGVVPEFQSQGYGGAFLTRTTETAWHLGSPTTRVWLQTSTNDHKHALPNYQARGFRVFPTS
jgi:GNAT superfamily N-acetyltransferase